MAIQGANPIGLQPGDQLSLRDLLYAALMQSDNIAAHTIAYHIGLDLRAVAPPDRQDMSPVDHFVTQMNALANQLGMKKTLFLNPHGLDHERPVPYTTAADMAKLARHAMNKSAFRFYASQKEREIKIQRGNVMKRYLLRNTNELLGKNDIDGIKTGRTRRAGDCLALSAAREPESIQIGNAVQVTPRRLTVVVLGATDRFGTAAGLLRRGWQLYDQWVAAGRPAESNGSP